MADLKKKIEALLFSSGRRMNIEEISRLCKTNPEEVKKTLNELKKLYEEKKSSLMVIDEGDFWKITIREQFLPLVQDIVTQTELSKTLMETLAVIAFKYPIKQSNLIKIRTNKAYDHLKELEEMGYITRQKYGRTKLIKLTQKFFDYFDLPPEKLKDKFETFEGIAKAIEGKEAEIKKMKEEHKKKLEEAKKKEEEVKKAMEKEGPEIDLVDEKGHKEKLEVYEEPEEKPKTEIVEEKLGKLDVVDEPEQEEEPEETEEPEEEKEEEPKDEEEKVQKLVKDILSEDKKEEPKEEKSDVDKKVEEMISGKEEEPEKTEEESETEKPEEKEEEEEQPKDILEAAQEEKEKPEEKK